ncbi:nucleoside triphosphate pyrophosphatase [Sphingomicrobium sp. XHP0239]|uniref:Maf family protein n=1 Tax=Sphingomicrobium maritimum TaxID=3133972 RepID=UPI0031CCA36C
MLILGSSSPIRAAMLRDAGIDFSVQKSAFDEDDVKVGFEGEAADMAGVLARGKALGVGAADTDLVIGGDSVLEVGGRRFDKPRDRAQAAEHLSYFSGRTMTLHSGVALARNGAIVWDIVDTARLEVRPLGDVFIDRYLDAEWPEVAYCVGVFRMEARGVTLFERIEGSHFTILGMPLLPLLGALRNLGEID